MANIGPAGGFWAPTSMFKEGPRPQAEFLNELQKIAVEKTRLKIPLLVFEEGTHGLLTPGCYSISGRSGNRKYMEYGSGQDRYIRLPEKKARTRGVHFLGTLVVEPNRDPRLGRNEEGYSEDPYLCSQNSESYCKGHAG